MDSKLSTPECVHTTHKQVTAAELFARIYSMFNFRWKDCLGTCLMEIFILLVFFKMQIKSDEEITHRQAGAHTHTH